MFRRVHRDGLTYLGASLLGLGDHAGAAEAAGKLAGLGYDPAKDLYPAARCLAGCSAAAGKSSDF